MNKQQFDRGRPSHQDETTGSLSVGEPVFLVVGKLGRPHGIRGEIQMKVLTDFPERLVKGLRVFVGKSYREMEFFSIRNHGNKMIVLFEGMANREQAGAFRNQFVYVKTAEIPELPEGELYHHEIIGMEIITNEGVLIGQIDEIIETGAIDVFVVQSKEGKQVLIPAVDNEVVLEINREKRIITVKLLPGLLPT